MTWMKLGVVAVVVVVLGGAAWLARPLVLQLVPTPLLPMPPHEQYAAALAIAGISTTNEGRAWAAAAERALAAPPTVTADFTRDGAFEPTAAAALAWSFPARRGQRVTIDTGAATDTVFVDMFRADTMARVASIAPRASTLDHIVDDDGALIVRLQPRLDVVAPTAYRVVQRTEASLRFPVQDRDRQAVGSTYGDGRDAGRRRHEGIDIFAPRGTPAIAAVDGWITQQTSNRLGGNVVWLWSSSRRLSLYYAHLDRQVVTPGQRVNAGDVVGYVGNTGNARGTPPHLHFGVYAIGDGAVDPLPFVIAPLDPPRRRGRTAR